jgi:predicted CoA-binding protein
MKTVVFGYSDQPEKYAYQAYHMLKEYQHEALAFNPRNDQFDQLPTEFHTLTMYVSAKVSQLFESQILGLNFKRIIFNPGAENLELAEKCRVKGIHVVEACTLVLLRTKQYEKA